MPRQHDHAKARRHWVYTREELSRLFHVSDSTITNWVTRGLTPIDDKRPQLFSGFTIRNFLVNMRWPGGRKPEEGRLFCADCVSFKPLIHSTIRVFPRDIRLPEVRGECTGCHRMLHAYVSLGELGEIYSASLKIPGDSSDVMDGRVSGDFARNGARIPPETNSFNLRRIHAYKLFLEMHQNFDSRTVDEHLRAISRMSGFFRHKDFVKISIEHVCSFKNHLRDRCSFEGDADLSRSTVTHTLDRCRAFFLWLDRQPGISLPTDLPGYFQLSRWERLAESSMVKGTSLTFDQALRLFLSMPHSTSLERRNQAIVAMFIVTGMRIAALISLRGKHVNMTTHWIHQDPKEVNTKNSKRITTYCLDLGSGLLDALHEWSGWRRTNGFDDEAPFFPPDRYIEANALGFGRKTAQSDKPQCWQSEDSVQRIIKEAAKAAGIDGDTISSHDFRKVLHPFLSRRGNMTMIEEVALALNFGHTPTETIRKHYASMTDIDRETVLDELCRKAISFRSELQLYLGYERNEIPEDHPDYQMAKQIFLRNSGSGAQM